MGSIFVSVRHKHRSQFSLLGVRVGVANLFGNLVNTKAGTSAVQRGTVVEKKE